MRKYLVLVSLLSFCCFLFMVQKYFLYTLLYEPCLLRYTSLLVIWSVLILLVVFVHLNDMLQSNFLCLLASEATVSLLILSMEIQSRSHILANDSQKLVSEWTATPMYFFWECKCSKSFRKAVWQFISCSYAMAQ